MADTQGMQDIRDINIHDLVTGFAEEEFVMKKLCRQSSTNAREVRWVQKTAGILTGTTTTGVTSNSSLSVAGARPTIVQPSWTKNTSYALKYFRSSGLINIEDMKDNIVEAVATIVRDVTRAVASDVDLKIIDTLAESFSVVNINSVTTTSVGGDQWDAASGQDPIKDINRAMRLIRNNSYTIGNGTGVLLLDPIGYESLTTWLISTKGSSIPGFSSQKVVDGVVMEILGLQVIVSKQMTTDYALVFIPQTSITWKSFIPLTGVRVEEPGIGMEFRVWEEGIPLLTDPKSVTLIIDLNT